MSALIRYTGVRVIDPAAGVDRVQSAVLQDGVVVALGSAADLLVVNETHAADGCWLTPAFVDLCARLREPGPKQHGTIASETRAAAAAGFKHLVLPPDTHPVIDHGAVALQVIEKAAAAGHAKVYPVGALTKGLEGKWLILIRCCAVWNTPAPWGSPYFSRQKKPPLPVAVRMMGLWRLALASPVFLKLLKR